MKDEFEKYLELEWADWFSMTPQERFQASHEIWRIYLSLGGSLEREPNPNSPFFTGEEQCEIPAYGGSGVRVIRRGPV